MNDEELNQFKELVVEYVKLDDIIRKKNEELKNYDLHNNKGYGTKKHMEALKVYGIVEGHRKSFKPCKI